MSGERMTPSGEVRFLLAALDALDEIVWGNGSTFDRLALEHGYRPPNGELDDLIDEQPPRHPDADLFVAPAWDRSGVCICGAWIAPQGEWVNPDTTSCGCGRQFVDEENFVAIYGPEASRG